MAQFRFNIPNIRSVVSTIRWRNAPSTTAFGSRTEKKFGANAVIDSWRFASQTRDKNIDPNALDLLTHYTNFLVLVDNKIDGKGAKSINDALKDPDVQQLQKKYYNTTLKFEDNRREKLQQHFADTLQRNIGAVKNRQAGLGGIHDVIEFRKQTTGEMGRAMAGILNIAHNIPQESSEKIERAFENLGMIIQIDDDLRDLSLDKKERTKENLVYQILKSNPEELGKVGQTLKKSSEINFRRFKTIAPITARAVTDLQRKYFDRFETEKSFAHLRGFANTFELR